MPGAETMAPSALETLRVLRDPGHFAWSVVPLGVLVVYVYGEQIAERRRSVVLGALAFWCMDWLNEILNALFFHFNRFAPLWSTPRGSAFVVLIGLNLEIACMFAVAGVAAMRMLPEDRNQKWLGLNNRLVLAAALSALSVGVEVLLNRAGALVWEWSLWRAGFPLFVFLEGYLPFYLVGFWVHDLPPERQTRAVGALGGAVAVALLTFGPVLGWL